MWLENVVVDARDPQRRGRFWAEALGLEVVTDQPDIYEARLVMSDGPTLDLCFQQVDEPTAEPRMHLDLRGGAAQAATVERLTGLGAGPLDIGQGEVPWVVMADVEGFPFCVMEEREAYRDTGPIAAIPIDSVDPVGDQRFWAELSGWTPVPGIGIPTLRHPSLRGPLLEFCAEPRAKVADKNPMHLDLRLDAGDDAEAVVRRIEELGGRELHHHWGDLPWRFFADPSGNDFCVLPARD